ncbi:MAG: zinc ABC transporter substrate-binding protein [Candidatus Cohnella colombiensis]|uniref:Zinc ABC transporter substrate-binding protein n=1 Tax=Candidatus Cohnella colombiensis TaxID=3121368 RepID=A0AA95EZB2_9BACL|nr:MAG: zinc ABC transporter substrate-binding protein [Cohnella sp.]
MKKSRIVYVLLFMMLLMIGSGCSSTGKSQFVAGKVNVVTTLYPITYFADQIGGQYANVINLVAAGVEPHDWTPKSQDLTAVSNAQLFLYNGAGLEGWVDQFLNGLDSSSSVVAVEVSHGIELIHGETEHDEQDVEDDHNHSDHDVDPHTWVSPRSALMMASNIRDALISVDEAHEAQFVANYEQLAAKLTQLDAQYTEGLAPYQGKDIVVSHQSFGYLCRDYGLHQISIMGLSPDAEPRAQDLLSIADYVKKHGITTIFFEELVTDRLASTLANEAKVGTMVLNPLEGLTPEQQKAGENYFTLMERNLQNLQKALQ